MEEPERPRSFCCKYWKAKRFLLQYDQPEKFVTALFQYRENAFYVVWRAFWAIYHLCWLVASICVNFNKWFIYVTNWSYVALTLDVILEFIAVLYVQYYRKDILFGACHEMPWYLQALWVVRNVANCAAVFVTVYYWIMVYRPPDTISPVTIDMHGLNSVYVMLNLMVSAVPVRLEHFYQPMIFSSCFIIFSVIHHVEGGINRHGKPYIYSSLDWNNPGQTSVLVVLMLLVAVPVNHAFLFFIYYLRTSVCSRGNASKNQSRVNPKQGP